MGWLSKIGKKLKKSAKKFGKFVKKNVKTVATVASSAAAFLPGGAFIGKGIDMVAGSIDSSRAPKAAQRAIEQVNRNKAQGKGGYTTRAEDTRRNQAGKSRSGGGGLIAGVVGAALLLG